MSIFAKVNALNISFLSKFRKLIHAKYSWSKFAKLSAAKIMRIRYLKWILFCNVLHQPSKTAIRVRFTVPSSPREFLKVFLQEIRICLPFHLLKFFLCCGPIALCVLCMDTGDWVYKVNRVINRLMIETQDPLHSSVCRPFISINPRAWLYVSLDNGQKSTCISPSHKL